MAAMALPPAGIDAVVYEAHAPTSQEEVGSYLTVASNGIDVAVSGPAASIIGWPNPPGDVALDPAHRIGGVVALIVAGVVDAARPVRPVALRGRRHSLPHRPPTPYQPLASRLNRRPVRFPYAQQPAVPRRRGRVSSDNGLGGR
jgi:hypothetical protein